MIYSLVSGISGDISSLSTRLMDATDNCISSSWLKSAGTRPLISDPDEVVSEVLTLRGLDEF